MSCADASEISRQGQRPPARPHVVVIGAGFAGLWAVRGLAGAPVRVTLVDRRNFHTFLPLLYQVAAAELEPEDIAYPVRAIVRRYPNVDFRMGEVTGVDLTRRQVVLRDGLLRYDFLVLAAGSRTGFFGLETVARHAFQLKELPHAIALRSHILRRFELAVHQPDPARRRRQLTFVVVGGGPTGVEFAGALAELIYGVLVRDYPRLDFREVRLVLLEAADRLLPALPARLGEYARRRLEARGVELRLATAVRDASPAGVTLTDGSLVETDTLVWTAGVQGPDLARCPGLPVGPGGRVRVEPTLQVPRFPEVYCVGDMAYLEGPEGRPVPLVAPAAIQQGSHAARNIVRQLAGLAPLPFRYRDPGTMVTIGRNAAVALLKGRALTGFPAWLAWLGVHLVRLIGFRNRLLVLVNWGWNYLFYDRGVRLVIDPPPVQGHQAPTETPAD